MTGWTGPGLGIWESEGGLDGTIERLGFTDGSNESLGAALGCEEGLLLMEGYNDGDSEAADGLILGVREGPEVGILEMDGLVVGNLEGD